MMAPWKKGGFGKGIFIGDGFAYKECTKIIGAIIFYSGDKKLLMQRNIEEATNDVSFGITDKGKKKKKRRKQYMIAKKISCTDEISPVGIFGQMKRLHYLC
jgi:hypothetical protein